MEYSILICQCKTGFILRWSHNYRAIKRVLLEKELTEKQKEKDAIDFGESGEFIFKRSDMQTCYDTAVWLAKDILKKVVSIDGPMQQRRYGISIISSVSMSGVIPMIENKNEGGNEDGSV